MRDQPKRVVIFFAGLIAALLILECGLWIFGFCYQMRRGQADQFSGERTHEQVVILCLGNSFTLGVGAPPGESYPDHLQRLFDTGSNRNRVVVVNKGMHSQNTAELLDYMQNNIDRLKPDLIVLQTGHPNWWNYSKYGNYLKRESSDKISFRKIFYSFYDFLYKSHVFRLVFLLKNDIKSRVRPGNADHLRFDQEYAALQRIISKRDAHFFMDEWEVNKALDFLKRAVRVDPAYSTTYGLIGQIYLYQKEYDKALEWFMKEAMRGPNYRDVRYKNRGYERLRGMKEMAMGGAKRRSDAK